MTPFGVGLGRTGGGWVTEWWRGEGGWKGSGWEGGICLTGGVTGRGTGGFGCLLPTSFMGSNSHRSSRRASKSKSPSWILPSVVLYPYRQWCVDDNVVLVNYNFN